MAFKTERKKSIENLFDKHKVVTLEDLKSILNTDFSMTVFRYLKEIGYLSSFNNAGRFYTLPHIPHFDKNGIWHHNIASFSELGTLKITIGSLIDNSPEGFTHSELKQLLRCRVQNTLNDLIKNRGISRESFNGIYVYLSADREKAVTQISQRKKKSGAIKQPGESIAPPVIIEILLELLRSSVWEIETLSRNLNARRVSVTKLQIKELLYHYNLKKKL